MTEQLAEQEIVQARSGYGHIRGEHDLEDGTEEDSCSDYMSAESDAENEQKEVISNQKDSGVLSSSRITQKSQPKSIVIPSTEELEIPRDNSDNSTFIPSHPGLPVMPSVPPQSPQEKARLAAKEGKVKRIKNLSVNFFICC